MDTCPNCDSSNIKILNVYDMDKNDCLYIEKGDAVCTDCKCKFMFEKEFELVLVGCTTKHINSK